MEIKTDLHHEIEIYRKDGSLVSRFQCDKFLIRSGERIYLNANNGKKIIPELRIVMDKYLKITYKNLSTGKSRY
jgi:hypothetical protein